VIKHHEELINKYIDNELNEEEIKEVQNLIQNDPSFVNELKAMKVVHQYLPNLSVSTLPKGFTERVMTGLIRKNSLLNRPNYFFHFIIGTFLTIILGVSLYNLNYSSSNESTEYSVPFLTKFIDSLKSLLGVIEIHDGKLTLIIGTVLSFILFATAFYMIESHKNLKKKLDSL